MGVKKKLGKNRIDKFYKLAKETGFRSRAAFKLIQLNRKFGFLGKSRVCIDLCAAPGGWMQVARKTMPVSSVIIGVDLYPIQAIPGCIGIVGDITTEETAKNIQKELKSWKADVVLNDGAPKVGANWLHDAYGQITLSLSALKLATKFLRKGGCFVSKVFRSKDYNAFVWVLKQLFTKVHATKPSASRIESAEIFVVCQGYIAPDRIDPKFLDPTYVFEELNLDPAAKISDLLHPEKQKKAKAEGYKDGDYTQHKILTAKEFIHHPAAIELLAGLAEIVLEDDEIGNHPRTTNEIRECCKDIKVLGRKDLRTLLSWWKAVREDLIGKIKVEKEDEEVPEDEKPEIDEDVEELQKIDKKIEALTEEEQAEKRRKRKKANKERQKLQERMNLKMVLKGDIGPVLEGDGAEFSLKTISNLTELTETTDQAPDVLAESDESEDEAPKPKTMRYAAGETRLDKSGMFYTENVDSEQESSSDEEDIDMNKGLGLQRDDNQTNGKKKKKSVRFADSEQADGEADDNDDDGDHTDTDTEDEQDSDEENEEADSNKKNPLITDLDYRSKVDKRASKAALWFEKDTFKNLTSEADEDFELDQMVEAYQKRGGLVLGEHESSKKRLEKPALRLNGKNTKDHADPYSDDSSDESDYDVTQSIGDNVKPTKVRKAEKKAEKEALKDGFEIVPQKEDKKKLKKLKLDEEGLALGALMVSSARTKRDILDGGWNKWVFNDANLPDWFAKDEEQHMKKELPVPQEMIDEYKRKMEEINIRPIKKVIEAKARKKQRAVRKLEKAKKKLESVMDNVDMSDKEKAKQIRQLYKTTKEKRKEVTYVIAKKSGATRKMRRPPGVKGPYRVVDARMKKDNRRQKEQFKKQGRKGKSTKNVDPKAISRMKKVQKVQNRAQRRADQRAAERVHTE